MHDYKSAPARILAPALRRYRGRRTDPNRWGTWVPRQGDILVCTPPKCGTTWSQTILAMLIHGGPNLPEKLPFLSPWVDADLGVSADNVQAALEAQAGRRVVKTHTPADGFPVWEGVTVIAVYRHPLDVFFSLRKHLTNIKDIDPDDPGLQTVTQSIRSFIDGEVNLENFDQDSLATVILHYQETVGSGRIPDLKLFHYADMLRDGHHAVKALAHAAEIDANTALIDRVAEATAFDAMKANAAQYAPVGGTGFWKLDANFFDSGTSQKWEGKLSDHEVARYSARLAALLPDNEARAWLENGDVPATTK